MNKRTSTKTVKFGTWLDVKKHTPEHGIDVIVCDDNGYVCIEKVHDANNIYVGKMTWTESWTYGNGTKIVAWMPLPEPPKELCNKDADGRIPGDGETEPMTIY